MSDGRCAYCFAPMGTAGCTSPRCQSHIFAQTHPMNPAPPPCAECDTLRAEAEGLRMERDELREKNAHARLDSDAVSYLAECESRALAAESALAECRKEMEEMRRLLRDNSGAEGLWGERVCALLARGKGGAE